MHKPITWITHLLFSCFLNHTYYLDTLYCKKLGSFNTVKPFHDKYVYLREVYRITDVAEHEQNLCSQDFDHNTGLHQVIKSTENRMKQTKQ